MIDVSFIAQGEGTQIFLGLRRPDNPTITGLSKLAQEYIMMLLRTPNFDSFNPDLGGGITAVTGIEGDDQIKSVIRNIIEKTTSDVRSVQAGQGLPTNERLSTVTIENIEISHEESTAFLEMRIIAESGEAGFVRFKVKV